jgi:hypothetical protein
MTTAELTATSIVSPSTGAIMKAYDTFGNAAKEGALKVILTNSGSR